jgi:hypothetical protein
MRLEVAASMPIQSQENAQEPAIVRPCARVQKSAKLPGKAAPPPCPAGGVRSWASSAVPMKQASQIG